VLSPGFKIAITKSLIFATLYTNKYPRRSRDIDKLVKAVELF